MKPLLIFKGTGQRIPDREKRQYDPRVVVKFQENAWCNEEMTVFWLRNMWKKPNMSGQPRDRLLISHAHRAQTTERVKTILTQECQTILGLVPPGATSKVQPLDVTFNAEFKKSVDRLATCAFHEMGGYGMARDLAPAERHSYPFICEMWNFTSHFR